MKKLSLILFAINYIIAKNYIGFTDVCVISLFLSGKLHFYLAKIVKN